MKRNYYEILGVKRDASQETIKRRFRQIAKRHHPDKGDSAVSDEVFVEAREAYETLGDPLKRVTYDEALSKQLVVNLRRETEKVVDDYFRQFTERKEQEPE
jgi:DnaJ-class molecular chaperone